MALFNGTEHAEGNGAFLRVSIPGSIIYVLAYIPIIFMCIAGNALVLISFVRFKRVRKINNYYLFGLAISDFLTGLVAMPLVILNRLIISETTCHARSRSFIFLPSYVLVSCSMCLLMGITVDRYIAISRPLRYQVNMTSSKTVKIILCWFIFGILFGTLPLWSFDGDPRQWVCELERYEATISTIHVLLGSALIPTWLLLLIIAYVKIFHIAYFRKDAVSDNRSRKAKSVRSRMRMRTTVTSAMVLGTFTILWLPHSFKNVFETYLAKDLKSLLAVQTFCEMLTYISSFVNPIIYGWRNRSFRTAYKKILHDCYIWRGKPNPRQNDSASLGQDERSETVILSSVSLKAVEKHP